jgi:membrane protein DedA with SNARE-associated domain
MIPVFAGVTHQSFAAVAVPVTVASAIWYGALVWLGVTAGGHLGVVGEWVAGTNHFLLVVALVVGLALGIWWLRTRRLPDPESEPETGEYEV